MLLEGFGESFQLLGVGFDGFQFWISDCFGGCCRRFWLLSWLHCGRRRGCRNCWLRCGSRRGCRNCRLRCGRRRGCRNCWLCHGLCSGYQVSALTSDLNSALLGQDDKLSLGEVFLAGRVFNADAWTVEAYEVGEVDPALFLHGFQELVPELSDLVGFSSVSFHYFDPLFFFSIAPCRFSCTTDFLSLGHRGGGQVRVLY